MLRVLFSRAWQNAPTGMGVRQVETVEGTQFTRGDYMLAVEWWDLDPSDPLGRTYKRIAMEAASGLSETICAQLHGAARH